MENIGSKTAEQPNDVPQCAGIINQAERLNQAR
jgi:hypothetical protein